MPIDEIHEEIKREDFFNRLKKMIPWIIAGMVIILGAAGAYSWLQWRADQELAKDEKLYEQALDELKRGHFTQASHLLSQLTAHSKGLGVLAWLQRAYGEQEDFRLTKSPRALEAMQASYRQIEKLYPYLPLTQFLMVSRSFHPLYVLPSDQKEIFMTPRSPWYPLALTCQALQTYEKGEGYKTAFARWVQETAKLNAIAAQWLAHYCIMGLSVDKP